ncbi:MAG: hypothetical protein R2705_18150 [Ilumatobacteraceae bacterium]
MDVPHEMICVAHDEFRATLACPICDRTVVVGLREPGLDVLQRGDQFARHVGGLNETVMAVSAAQP